MLLKCKVKRTDNYSPEKPFPEKFKLNSKWDALIIEGMYYIGDYCFTNNEYNHYFTNCL